MSWLHFSTNVRSQTVSRVLGWQRKYNDKGKCLNRRSAMVEIPHVTLMSLVEIHKPLSQVVKSARLGIALPLVLSAVWRMQQTAAAWVAWLVWGSAR